MRTVAALVALLLTSLAFVPLAAATHGKPVDPPWYALCGPEPWKCWPKVFVDATVAWLEWITHQDLPRPCLPTDYPRCM